MEVDVVSLAAEFPNDNPALHHGARWVCLEVTGLPVAIAAPLPPHDSCTTADESAGVPSMSITELLTSEPLSAADVVADEVVEVVALPIPPARISEIVELGATPRDQDELVLDLDLEEAFLVEDLPPLEESASVEGVELAAAPALTTPIAPPPSDDPWTAFLVALADVAIGEGSPHVASLLPALLFDGKLEAMPDDAVAALAEADVARDGAVTPAFAARMNAWRAILRGTSDDFEACGSAMLDEWAAELLARLLGAPARATLLRRELRSRGVAAFGLATAA